MAGTASRLWSELAKLALRPSKPVPASSTSTGTRIVAQSLPIWEPSGDAVRVMEEGHRKVIKHYQEVLRTQTLTTTERAIIEERIAREEEALNHMTQDVASQAA